MRRLKVRDESVVMELRYGKVFGNVQGRERKFYWFTTKIVNLLTAIC